ncbi:Enkurin domain-containing protein 1 [Bulinus truncatus]|nr:Enkurin domain-containing protein 1 [Bulinus truncatus]
MYSTGCHAQTQVGLGQTSDNFLKNEGNSGLRIKNQLNENVRRLREIQHLCKQKQEEKQEPVKVLWKSEKYSNVESKIKQDIQKPLSSRPDSANFLRAHSRAGPPVKLESLTSYSDISHKTTVPPASDAKDVKLLRPTGILLKLIV